MRLCGILIALILLSACGSLGARRSPDARIGSGGLVEFADRMGLRDILTPRQYAVTQEDATEPPFDNAYWDETRPGIYVDIVSGEPLFSSIDKYDSGTGWPSFKRPLEPGNLTTRTDLRLIAPRTEVRSLRGYSHLGHVFRDGPPPTGLRYCINSAALRFILAEDLETEGYGQYEPLFEASGRGETAM